MEPRLVIAIGGNGFTSATSPGLDDLVLGAVPGGVRRIGFVGTASEDDPVRIGIRRNSRQLLVVRRKWPWRFLARYGVFPKLPVCPPPECFAH
jgi:hypothetical protein